MNTLRYLVTGGGTGGHIYPALAVCKMILSQHSANEVVYVGSRRGLEAEIVPRERICFETIDVQGIMGKSMYGKARGVLSAARSTLQATSLIRKHAPGVVLGTGGYVSGPVVLAAWMSGVPAAIQEQNAVPGATNRLLSRLVHRVFTPFKGTESHFAHRHKCVFTGNPIRPEILAATRDDSRHKLGLDPGRKVLFVFGGSRGARRIVELVLEILERRLLPERVQVLLVTGAQYESDARERLSHLGISTSTGGDVIVRGYLHEIENALAASDLVVGRAGGMTVSEILARGLPSILIPSPNVTGNHQLYNARAASTGGGALLMREQDATAVKLAQSIEQIILDDGILEKMAESARALGRPRATSDILEQLQSIARVKPLAR